MFVCARSATCLIVTPAKPREAKSLSVELSSLCFVLRLLARMVDWGVLIGLILNVCLKKSSFSVKDRVQDLTEFGEME